MKNKSIGFIVILLLAWFFAKDNKAPSSPAAERTESSASLYTQEPAQESGTSEQAKIGYVNANTLKVRSTPNGLPLESLQRGAQVKVYEQRNDWSRISAANEKERWVSSSYLCESTNCYVKKVTPPSPEKLRTEHRTTPSRQHSAPQNYGSSCPCSSGTVCIGPRGGRYCITSGGNKRYGV